MSHRLRPLLNPDSVAVIGASERVDSPGRETIRNLLNGNFKGPLFAVNPRYGNVCGVPCHATLADLPRRVEQVMIVVGDARAEGALEQAIDHGAKSVVVVSSLTDDGREPPLMQRVQARAREAGLVLMGGNTMGYYNFTHGVWACAFDTRDNHVASGGITLITHSGAGMSGLIDCDERLDCNLAISTGQELGVTMDEYMDYALEQSRTRVIGLFMETARNPQGLRDALRKARDKKVPVVALKVGKTEFSARLTESHSGALAGRDSAFEALFERYGVIRVSDMDEFSTTLIMFAQPHPVAPGGLVSIHDSGGERQLMVDVADELDLPLAELSDETVIELERLLDPGLPAVNPLDAWSTGGEQYHTVMEDCLAAMMRDDTASMGAVIQDRAPNSGIYPDYVGYLRKGHQASGKPAFLVANRQGTGSDPTVIEVTREGFPVLDGLRPFIVGARGMMAYRDFHSRPARKPPLVDEVLATKWRARLDEMKVSGAFAGEAMALELLRSFGVPANRAHETEDIEETLAAAVTAGFPVVLKTAQPGIVHKSDVGGVRLRIAGEPELRDAYADLAKSLGPRVAVAPQVDAHGVDMMLGMIHDEQFGPLVLLGFGGRDVEVEGKVAFLLPPFDAGDARRAVDRLPGHARLDEHRGRGPLALDAFCQAAARFSVMVLCLSEQILAFDVNPVIVGVDRCIAVDAHLELAVGEAVNCDNPASPGHMAAPTKKIGKF